MKTKTILVTGAAGFIGFHLSKRLSELGHTVIGIDNINDYYDINLKYNSKASIDTLPCASATVKLSINSRCT